MVMLPHTSSSFNNTINSSGFNSSSVEQKKWHRKVLTEGNESLTHLEDPSVDNDNRLKGTMQVVQGIKEIPTDSFSVRELSMHSHLMYKAGQQVLTSVSNIQVNTNVYSAMELALHIKDNPEWWQFSLPRQVSSAAALHGAVEPRAPPARPRAAHRRRPPANAAASRRPERVDSTQRPAQETAQLAAARRRVAAACARGPLSYWHAVLHPASFALTVHNVYYLAFLLKDGQLDVYYDEELGIPMIRTADHAQDGGQEDSYDEQPSTSLDPTDKNQFIVTIDMERWQALVKACGIKEPLLVFTDEAGGTA